MGPKADFGIIANWRKAPAKLAAMRGKIVTPLVFAPSQRKCLPRPLAHCGNILFADGICLIVYKPIMAATIVDNRQALKCPLAAFLQLGQ
jgi:hypothetical protein